MEDPLLNIDGSQKRKVFIWRLNSFLLFFILILLIILYTLGVGWKTKIEDKNNEYEFTLWNPNSSIYTKLIPYIKNVTDENSQDYIPVEDRIAVFDLDGTLFCETDPVYFDWIMYTYRVLDDPEYKEKAEEDDKIIANKIRASSIYDIPSDIEEKQAGRNLYVFKDMKMDEYMNYTKKILSQNAPGYTNMKRGNAFYQPMLEVVKYLQNNDFNIFIVSGADRFEIRAIIEGKINISESQIIGTISNVKASGQGNNDGLHYQFTKNDNVILGGELSVLNVKMNKVNTIITEIGKKPVLSFGNSEGDTSMANFVVNNNKYKSLAFQICCDDIERENGNLEKANIMKQLCQDNNWEAISMKDDWKTIYGSNVKRNLTSK